MCGYIVAKQKHAAFAWACYNFDKSMPNKKFKICVIMPAYNEERVIEGVIRDLTSCLETMPYNFEVVVVNDGSKDRTRQVAAKSGATVIDHILNSGVGGATATGLAYAARNSFDVAAIMDSDGQHLPADLINGIKRVIDSDVDLLIGSRLINSDGMSAIKKLGNWGLSLITYLLFGVKQSDSQSGLRIFSKNALCNLSWNTSGYEFCSEMLWRSKQLGLKIDEYPIKAVYTDYSKSKGQNNWNGINIVKDLLKQRIKELLR